MAFLSGLIAAFAMVAVQADGREITTVRIPINQAHEVDLAEVVTKLGAATGVPIDRRGDRLPVPIVGLAGNLSRTMLAETLGPDVIHERPGRFPVHLPHPDLPPGAGARWIRRLRTLANYVDREIDTTHELRDACTQVVSAERPGAADGLPGARDELVVGRVRAHDPAARGGGVRGRRVRLPVQPRPGGVVRAVRAATGRRSAARRARRGPGRSWRTRWGRWWRGRTSRTREPFASDVSTLILIAPVNQGSSLAKAQTLMQLLNGVQAVNGKKAADALASWATAWARRPTTSCPAAPS